VVAAVPFLVEALKDAPIWDVALKETLDLPNTLFLPHLMFPVTFAGAFNELGADDVNAA
jgi:hypothetical protein